MSFFSNRQYYGLGAKLLHWGLGALIIGFIVSVKFSAAAARGDGIHSAHAHFSLAIFALMLLWLLWQIINPRTEFLEDVKAMNRFVAAIVHIALFTLTLAAAAAGVMAAQLEGIAVSALGMKIPKIIGLRDSLIALPEILDWNIERAAARDFRYAGNLMSSALAAVIGLHFLAALYHHFFAGDDTLRRMWFGYR